MILGIVGDTHNNLKNISKICEIFNKENTDLVLHTGDITLPKSLHAFNSLKCNICAVFGNNDIEEKESLEKVAENMNCIISDEPYFFKIEGVSICLIHHPELIDTNLLDRSDIIFHGHTHRYRNEIIKNTLIFNPGECAGFMQGKNQVGILNLKDKLPKIINF